MIYGINDKPPIGSLFLYGLQWFIVALPSAIIMGLIVSSIHYPDMDNRIFYMQKLFAIMGVGLVVQTLWGHKLPLVTGPATTLLVGIIACSASTVETIYTGILIGGLVMVVVGYSGLLSKLRIFFTPRIVTVILGLIAFTLAPTILNMIFSSGTNKTQHLSFAFVMVFGLVVCNNLLRGIWKSLTVPIGIACGSIAYITIFGLSPITTPAHATVLAPLFIGLPKFDAGVIISFQFCFLALLVNEMGSIESVGHMLRADDMPNRLRRGVALQGASNTVSGFLGVIGSVDFSFSAGVIAGTRCASRYPFIPAGIALFVCAFIPPLMGILARIPQPVMGALMVYLMTTQLASSLSILVAEKGITDFDSGVVVSLSLLAGILVSFMPPDAFDGFPDILRPIVGNGFTVGTITVLLLEHVVFRKKTACGKERA